MWDTVHEITDRQHSRRHLLCHDLPCLTCGHAAHTYLACDAACDCRPVAMPGARA